MPPEYRNDSASGWRTTISAPSRERMMSSIACRSSVPGAMRASASRSWESRRGSSSDGVRVKPRADCASRRSLGGVLLLGSVCIECGLDRLPEGLRFEDAQFATSGGRSDGHDGGGQPELRAFLE